MRSNDSSETGKPINLKLTLIQCFKDVFLKSVAAAWKRCQHLIIDEVSMVDGRFFEKLEQVARGVKNNNLPFGGIQLILAGDFLQLPPVTKGKTKRKFCFETSAWLR